MRDMMLDALLPESMSDEAAYHLVYFIGNLARTLECIYHLQIKRHASQIEEEFDYPKSDLLPEVPPF